MLLNLFYFHLNKLLYTIVVSFLIYPLLSS
nr:MAG TPA: hypothetical protein [Crassvirales sp.]